MRTDTLLGSLGRGCALLLLPALAACSATGGSVGEMAPMASAPAGEREAFASTYAPRPHAPVLIRGGIVLTGTGERLDDADVLLADNRVVAVGRDLDAPRGAEIVDAAGMWVTPGIIDVHSHLGDYAAPRIAATSDGNEATSPVTAQVWAEHSVWPQDPQFPLALAGGTTTLQILPGSANLIGGRGVTLKNVPGRSVMDMKFPGAPHGLKMACGENPKRVYGRRGTSPSTRMGNVAGYRAAWIEAQKYLDDWEAYERKVADGDDDATPPKRDLKLESLAGVLRGEIIVHNHCYRADEMLIMLDIAREFGYRVGTFHHGIEAYKIADVLAEEGVCGALWVDWWGGKLEQADSVEANIPLVDRQPGSCAIVHSDSARDIQRLNQEAGKAMAAGRRMGMDIDEAHAITWVTLNAARSLGIDDQTGTLEPGKMADVVLWNTNPLSVYARAQKVWIDGYRYYDRDDASRQPLTDFDLGQTARGLEE